MNKKGKNIELRIYELLGVKLFKKMAFGLRNILRAPFALILSKEDFKDLCNNSRNYNMKKGHGIQDLRNFKKMLLLNTCIHVWALYNNIPYLLSAVRGAAPLPITISTSIVIGISCYSIMLQRYNHIRINQTIKRLEPREEVRKVILKEKLIKEDSLLCEHTYKVVNMCNYEEKTVTFEELLETATYDQLKQYRDYLSYFKDVNQEIEECQKYGNQDLTSVRVPLQKNEILKLELRQKKQN